ncbi:VOC family protein [Kibdelosporangium philippinense]|uniref:VOC family protein n=1 Tax=Kibdelosporangium philippinense TaxID=211113 RepID=A0ABS8Z850_9PSEU|nr:VOC family protein [Kibdelosporangium philippinense]MCE7004069.1 VOC family protein [Kibdelosporangium philippinense]
MTVRLNAISIVVADMGRSLAFYRLLGLAIPAEADSQPHVEVDVPGGMRLLWDTEATIRSFAPGWQRRGSGGMSLAFAAEDAAGVDKMYAQLADAGYHGELAPWDAFWGQRYAVVHDPDGNGVDLFAAL